MFRIMEQLALTPASQDRSPWSPTGNMEQRSGASAGGRGGLGGVRAQPSAGVSRVGAGGLSGGVGRGGRSGRGRAGAGGGGVRLARGCVDRRVLGGGAGGADKGKYGDSCPSQQAPTPANKFAGDPGAGRGPRSRCSGSE